MKCPICEKGTLKKGNNQKNKVFLVRRNSVTCEVRSSKLAHHFTHFSRIKEVMFGVYLGEFPAEICTKCNESFTDEKTTKAIEEAAKKNGIWGLGKKTKTRENQRFSGHKQNHDFAVQKIQRIFSHQKSNGFFRVTKTENSLAVRIPKEIVKFLNLKEGNEAYIHPEKDRLVIEAS